VFAYNSRTDGRDMLVLALNEDEHSVIVTWNYNAFRIKGEYKTLVKPEYLYSFFLRSEFDRRVRFNSWGSSQELLSWDNFCDIKVPIPVINEQESIAKINHVFLERKAIVELLKEQIKNICPVLIRGSLTE
jgi:type I restriction enzyme S subunit